MRILYRVCFFLQICFITFRHHSAVRISTRLMEYVYTVSEPTGSYELYLSDEVMTAYSHCITEITVVGYDIRTTGLTEATCVYSCTSV
jgi:hypothetical protein